MSLRIAAADLGKSSAKLLTGRADAGQVVVEETRVVDHQGAPLEVFSSWYRERDLAQAAALGVTGLYADEVREPALSGLPEDACLEASLALMPELSGPMNLL